MTLFLHLDQQIITPNDCLDTVMHKTFCFFSPGLGLVLDSNLFGLGLDLVSTSPGLGLDLDLTKGGLDYSPGPK